MKKILLTLIMAICMIATSFSQNFLAHTKTDILSSLKDAVSVSSSTQIGDTKNYSITVTYPKFYIAFSFTEFDQCYFYFLAERWTDEIFNSEVGYLNERFSKVVLPQGDNIWREYSPSLNITIYRWMLVNETNGTIYIIYCQKENYEKNRAQYMKSFLNIDINKNSTDTKKL